MYTLYSKRIKDAAGDPEVYVYDVFPQAFRNQTFYALSDVLDYFEKHGGALRNGCQRRLWACIG